MSRLVDYFVVVGYDHDKERAGKILQRFPEYDWPETPFHQGIEMFCQPQGWKTHQSPKVPEFLLSVLTDVDAYRHYCACLTFTEAFIPTAFTDDEDEDPATIPQVLYAPKSICIISRHEYFETFRQCLGVIYTVYVDKLPVKMEVLIGNLLGFIQVPPPGGPQIRFSLGAEDRQCVQPPLLASIPTSRDSIATFCQELGISNVMLLLSAALIDSKILVYSSSYSRLTNACHALTTLCYPLKYSYVYVPVLPAPLLEVLNSPTPFIMGIHSSLKDQVADLLDVIFVDLDGCQVEIPENVTIPLPPEPIFTHTISSLKMVMDPFLLISDHAFPGTIGNSNRSLPEMLDKEIRAVFIQFFCEIFAGYRSCLTVVRIHPEPFVQFQKAQFLGMRGLVGDEFVTKVISSMSFGRFVHEFASPFRVANIFDETYAEHKLSMEPLESDDMKLDRLSRIKEISHRLYTNENPHTSAYAQKLLRPSESAMMKPVPGYTFPRIDVKIVADIIQDGIAKQSQMSKWPSLRTPSSQVIPMGPNTAYFAEQIVAVNSARRLEVLSNCITHIFENRINDAKKLQPAVMRVLSNPSARLALSAELSRRVQSNRAMLEHQQFEMVVQLINCALQDDSVLDEYGVAASFLPLTTAFCRKLCTGVIQFAYTRIQDHEIWANLGFWESAFYKDVQQHITALYWPSLLTSGAPVIRNTPNLENRDEKGIKVAASRSEENLKALSTSLTAPTALDIAADQIRSWNTHSAIEQKETIDREESTVFSQAIHYANRIVYLRVPLDASSSSRVRRRNSMGTDTQSNSNFTNSVQESDTGSMSEESGFQDEEKTSRESSGSVIRFVTKFVDKVCGESHVSEEHIRQLHQMIPGVVAMHIEGLEAVYRESKHLQPIPKPKITEPPLLPGEDFALDRPLRAHLLVDGREETSGINGAPCLIPCDGALFLTTYRVIFMGSPVDQYVNSDYTIIRAFPLAALTKEKRLAISQMPQGGHFSSECYQLRSATFQLIRVAFDEEVSSDHIDNFRRCLIAMRYPNHAFEIINQTLAPSNRSLTATKTGKKPGSIKGFAKKTLLRTAKAAGIKTKSLKKDGKYFNPNPTPLPDRRYQLTIASDGTRSAHPDEDASEDESDTLGPTLKEVQSFERVKDRCYVKDFLRIGLATNLYNPNRRTDEFRLSQVNLHYKVCVSYPALVVIPNNISDETLRNLARNFKENRFPIITWQHPRTKAVLVRSSAYHNARMGSVFKNSAMSTAGSMMTIPTSAHQAHEIPSSAHADFEKYLRALINILPGAALRHPSLSSVTMQNSHLSYAGGTPDSVRKLSVTPWNRAVQTLRTSTGKSGATSKRSSMFLPGEKGGSLMRGGNSELTIYSNADSDSVTDDSSASRTAFASTPSLYIFCDKSSLKAVRSDTHRCDFRSIDYPDVRRVKSGYKKMLQVLVPSSKEASNSPQGSFYRQIENLDWLKQIEELLKLSGVVVDVLDSSDRKFASSVMLSVEEGWDVTCQISALAQLFLDPKYRTIEGFGVLVEKEFAAYGHRFAHRNNLTHATKDNGIAPLFVQFLDCVHQVHRQFPLSFEFNMYYLKFLAYHSMSNRFTNFLTDSEAERVELGLLENRKEMDISNWPVTSGSIWDYVECVNKKSPKFFNFLFTNSSSDDEDNVLRPFPNAYNIVLWDFYLEESLAFGSLYDLELVDVTYGPEPKHNVGKDCVRRRFVNNCYNNASLSILNSFTTIFEEIAQLQSELGMEVEEWQEHWENFNQDGQLIVPLQKPTGASQMIRSQSRRLQTQITLDILDKSKNGENGNQALGHPHRFVQESYTTPTHCHQCNQVLWGNGKLAVVCADCGFHAHEKCAEQVGNTCIKVKVMASSTNTETVSTGHVDQLGSGRGETLRDVSPTTPLKSQYSELNNSSLLEGRAMEGFLYKRGAVLKGWKQKYFILDSMHHQLQYFETINGTMDPQTRGAIDLAEVVSVGPSTSTSIILQGAPKKFDSRACFDVRTHRRTYNLCAKDPVAAHEWIEKIQLYLQ